MAKVRKISTLRFTEVPGLYRTASDITSLDATLTPGWHAYTSSCTDLPEFAEGTSGVVFVFGRYTENITYQILFNGLGKIGFRNYIHSSEKWGAWMAIMASLP